MTKKNFKTCDWTRTKTRVKPDCNRTNIFFQILDRFTPRTVRGSLRKRSQRMFRIRVRKIRGKSHVSFYRSLSILLVLFSVGHFFTCTISWSFIPFWPRPTQNNFNFNRFFHVIFHEILWFFIWFQFLADYSDVGDIEMLLKIGWFSMLATPFECWILMKLWKTGDIVDQNS